MAKITREALQNLHPHDLSTLFLTWDDDERQYGLSQLSDHQLAEVFSYLKPEIAVELLGDLDLRRQAHLVDLMEPDDARDLLSAMGKREKQAVLEKLTAQDTIRQLLSYDEDESGAHMTTDLIRLTPTMEIKTATKHVIAYANEVESISRLFVVDQAGRFLGAVSLKRLLKAKPPQMVQDIMEDYPHVLDTDPVEATIHKMRDYTAFEMPVCTKTNQLVGMIMMDDALDTYHEEATEDYEKLSALPQAGEKEHFSRSAFKRLPWLLILLVLSIPIAYITTLFEEILVAVAILAFFQPLILDASGDVATQTLAVTLRILTKNPHKALKNGVKEVMTGFLTGLIMGGTAAVIAYFLAERMHFAQPFALAAVVGLSLWITVIISPILGVLIPVGINKLGLDPAAASGPLITTLSDLTSLLVFFGLSTSMLGGL